MSVTLIDLGYGNLGSIRRAFARIGAEVVTSSDPGAIAAAERLVLPGVGSAGFAMASLRELGLEGPIRGFRRPLLGICLGMQLMFDWSEEDDTHGLGLLPGGVHRMAAAPGRPVPHMGWSRLAIMRPSHGLEAGDYVYFAHSFRCADGRHAFAWASHGEPIPAAVRRDNLFGCQFHPERSAEAGQRFLQGFLQA
jgi:glutamine amidotransferase